MGIVLLIHRITGEIMNDITTSFFCKKLNRKRNEVTGGNYIDTTYPLIVYLRNIIDHVQIDSNGIESHAPLIQQQQRHC